MSKENIKYDPNVKYGWTSETKFEISGNEFGLILNTVRATLSTEEAQKILLLSKANDALEDVLRKNVENGNVKPAPTESLQQAERSLSKMQVVEDKS